MDRRKISLIVIHCSASPNGRPASIEDIDAWHRDRLLPQLRRGAGQGAALVLGGMPRRLGGENMPMREEMYARLENWRNWAHDRMPFRRTRSLEGHYRPPQCWEPVAPSVVVDIWDAIQIERAIVRLPDAHRIVVVGHHLYRADPRVICRRARVNWHGFDEHLRKAETMLQNNLRAIDLRRR